jgi:hypothetical protein
VAPATSRRQIVTRDDIGKLNRKWFQPDLSYVSVLVFRHLKGTALPLLILAGKGENLIRSYLQGLSSEIQAELESTFAVCRLSVYFKALISLTPQKLHKCKGISITRERVPIHRIDDPSTDGSNGPETTDRHSVGANATADKFEIAASGRAKDKNTVSRNSKNQPRI